jgi:hypothetical protein
MHPTKMDAAADKTAYKRPLRRPSIDPREGSGEKRVVRRVDPESHEALYLQQSPAKRCCRTLAFADC